MSETKTAPELSEPDLLLARETLHAMAGPDAVLRDDQLRAVSELVQPAARVLVVQATGWGKSAVYWIATAIRRAEGAGPTLVVSPLLSLMRDQVESAGRAGLSARTMNSSNFDAWSEIEAEIRADAVDVLLVSPERLANPKFAAVVLDAIAGRLGMVVIDEAHSISDWGHDFRPDYRRLQRLLTELSPDASVLATTATANARVTDDVAAQLGEQAVVLRGPLARDSLRLAVTPPLVPIDRYAWVCEQLPQLPGSGIVYVLTVHDAEQLTAALRAAHGDSYPVAAYTGGLEASERERLEDRLRSNDVKALIATSALGMGFDKPDLGFVVHVGSPPSPVSYYQQVGRAGRGIDEAQVVLLPSESDRHIWEYFATATIPVPAQVDAVLEALRGGASTVPQLEAQAGVRRTKVELILKQLAVDGVTERFDGGWRATGTEWVFDRAHYDGIVAMRRREADIMRAYAAGEQCLMQLLQESLDDPSATPCERCSVCDPAASAALQRHPSAESIERVGGRLREQVAVLEPRKMWPGGPCARRGRIGPGQQAELGRVLVDRDAPQWSELLRGSLSADMPADEDLRDAVVRVLARWSRPDRRYGQWSRRPEVVVALAAGGLPTLVETLADHIAETGRMQRAAFDADAIRQGVASAAREDHPGPALAAVWDGSIVLPDEAVEVVNDRSVLLVVDQDASGWPTTIAAAVLREAGADVVLPLLLRRPAAGG